MALPPEKKRRKQGTVNHSGSSVQQSADVAHLATSLQRSSSKPTVPLTFANNKAVRSSTRTRSVARRPGNASDTKNIHSFFNARTNSQTQSLPLPRSQTASSPHDAGTSFDLEEDSIEEVADTPSSSHQTKRSFCSKNEAASSKKGTPSSGKGVSLADISAGQKRDRDDVDQKANLHVPWADAFPPLSLEELAVNKKKIDSINIWMKEALSGHRHRRILVLRGPAGCGKSSTIKLLAKARRATLAEWSNPLQAVFGDENYVSISAQFSDFVSRGGQFSMLNLDDKQMKGGHEGGSLDCSEILFVDELPLAYQASNTNVKLREILMLHLEADRASPLVLVFSEDDMVQSDLANSTTAYHLLGSDLLAHPATAVIDCNKIAATYMVKALELVIKKGACKRNRAKPIPSSTLRTLASSGDIRSAIGLLQILCTEGHITAQADNLPTKRALAGSKIEAGSDDLWLLQNNCREASMGLFHAIGKVMYNKRERMQLGQSVRSSTLPLRHHNQMASVVEIEEIVRFLGSDTDTFIAGLQENYAPSCDAQDCLSYIEACALELSSADLLSTPQYTRANRSSAARAIVTTVEQVLQQDIATQAAIRGLLYSLPYPVRRGGTRPDTNSSKMTFPTSMRLPKQEAETLANIERWLHAYPYCSDGSSSRSSYPLNAPRRIEAWKNHDASADSAADFKGTRNNQITMPNSMAGLSNRTELVLVQLPYQLKIMSIKAPMSDLHILKQIAEVRKLSHSLLSSGNGNSQIHPRARQEPLDSSSNKLFLSDDDIEEF